jgi:transmembrane sensor
MKAPMFTAGPDHSADARAWFVRMLDEDVTREDLVAWAQWLESDPLHREAYERVEDAWRRMQAAGVSTPTEQELAEDRYQPQIEVARWRKSGRTRPRLAWSLAAGVALCLAGAGLFWLTMQPTQPHQFATQRARSLDARLQDGSRVQLGALTTLKVSYSAHARDANLVQGEALFHVAHDRARPFVVHTPLAAITAVGTAFDIDIETDAVTLNVTEGVVAVAPDVGGPARDVQTAAMRVQAGQKLRMERNGSRLVLALSNGDAGATWTEGRLEYRDVVLQSVINDVNRYTTRPIIVADPALAGLRYTGTVQLEAADTWVLGLSAAFPVSVELDDRGEFVLREKAGAPASQASLSARSRTERNG